MATLPNLAADAVEGLIGRRGASRARVQLNAALETTTEEVPVVLRNLSCTGAMLEGKNLPTVNRTAVLKRGGVEAMGVVVWHAGDRCGFHFFDPISHKLVVEEARRAPEAPAKVEKFHWTTCNNAVTAEQWRKAQEEARRERSGLKGFS